MLEQMQLVDLRHNLAEELSGGQQKLLEMARMLMPDPRSSCWTSRSPGSIPCSASS